MTHASFPTIVDCLRWRAEHEGDKVAYTFLERGRKESAQLTYLGLDERARAIAAHLRAIDGGGGRALLLYPAGLEVIAAFFGCLYAGVVAVPLPPPEPGRVSRAAARLQTAVRDSGATLALTTPEIYAGLSESLRDAPELAELSALRFVLTSDLLPDPGLPEVAPRARPEQLAFLQYTSGSTSSPKGVMVSHGNLAHNSGCLQRGFRYDPTSIAVGWMPYFHDFGLVEGIVQPLWSGIPTYLLSPLAFLKRPLSWLEAISRHRATHSHAPCFGFERCLQKVTPRELATLDLSCWRVAAVGAEPVREEVMRRFAATFAPCGFRAAALSPGFGMAEATLGVTVAAPSVAPRALVLDAAALRQGRVSVRRAGPLGSLGDPGDAASERVLMGCGVPMTEDVLVAIVAPETRRRVAADEVGELWVAGPSVAGGYWQRPELTQAGFAARIEGEESGPWLRTGDLGFLYDGELVITGRLKDIFIFRGENHYPQDIEESVAQCHPALLPGGAVAFGIEASAEDEERLVIVQAVQGGRLGPTDGDEIIRRIRRVVADEHGLEVAAIALVPPGMIGRTTSGKLARSANRERFLSGELEALVRWSLPAPERRTEATAAPEPDATTAAPESDAADTVSAGRTAAQLLAWLGRFLFARGKSPSAALDPSAALLDFGLDSVAVVEVAVALEDELGLRVDPGVAWRFPDLAGLCEHLAQRSRGAAAPGPADVDDGIDLRAEASLDPAIQPPAAPPRAAPPARVLLTGATGFLGAFLLEELLRTSDVEVHCLVRAASAEQGFERIAAALRGYGLHRDDLRARVHALAGDLARPRLGLSDAAFAALGESIDVIYHAGSLVNFVYPYAALRPTNVRGTEEILRLAATARRKPVHNISSFSVVGQPAAHPKREVADLAATGSLGVYDDRYAQRKLADLGYVQAKRVTDLLVQEAQARGLPIATYRPGFISGHSETGAGNAADYVSRLLRGCVLLGAAPDQPLILNLAPVDYVVRAIVHLASQTETAGRGFDILNPAPLSWNAIVALLGEHGYPLRLLPPEAWRAEVLERVRSPSHPLFSLLPLLSRRPADRLLLGYPTHFRGPQMMAELTTGAALRGTAIRCPPIDGQLLRTYLRSFVAHGHLPRPAVE